MSRVVRRRGERGSEGRSPGGQHFRIGVATPWIVAAGIFTLLVGGILLGFGSARGNHHPEPRPAITGGTVVPASRYAGYDRVSAVYGQAAEVAAVLDGLYCYCDCSRHSGHRSLLTCFESDHGAACDVCLTEAAIAYRMTKDGRSLDEIRDAIDELFGG